MAFYANLGLKKGGNRRISADCKLWLRFSRIIPRTAEACLKTCADGKLRGFIPAYTWADWTRRLRFSRFLAGQPTPATP